MASLVSLACSTERSLRFVVTVLVAVVLVVVPAGGVDVVGKDVDELFGLSALFLTTLPSCVHHTVTIPYNTKLLIHWPIKRRETRAPSLQNI